MSVKKNRVEQADQTIEPDLPGKDVIEIMPLENPAYASLNEDFLAMLKEFAEHIAVPQIRYESLHNYLCEVVKINLLAKLRGEPEKLSTSKLYLGFVNGKLAGFSHFYLYPNRLPHIQTMDWAYCHTKNLKKPGKADIRVSYRFALEVRKWKKIWGARYISMVVADDGLNRIVKRLFKKPKACGVYYVSEDIRSDLIKTD